MGLANDFNDIIEKHLNVFAAWIPIVNKYTLGDYGVFSDGIFSKLGNIKDDFNVDFKQGAGSEASIDFTSAGAKVFKFAGGAKVDVIPAGAVDAKIDIEFSNKASFLVKSPTITVATIDNVNEVAQKLKDLKNWDGQWKVVYQVYNALDAVIVSTIDTNTIISFSGDATALGQMKLGNAGINFNTSKALGLNITGKNGVIGLGVFRIKSKIFGGMKVKIMVETAAGEGPVDEEPIAPIYLEPGKVKSDL